MKDFRDFFPYTINVSSPIYFDSAATTQKPKVVLDTIQAYLNDLQVNTDRAGYGKALQATASVQDIREKVKHFINANMLSEVVFTSGTTEGVNIASLAWGLTNLQDGDNIVLNNFDHHSLIAPWMQVVEILKKEGKHIEIIFNGITQAGCFDIEELKEHVTDKTKLVVLSHIHNVYGTKSHVEEIRGIVGENAAIFVDLSQSIGHVPIDVQAMDIDMAVFSGHKMFALPGSGILWIHNRHHKSLFAARTGGASLAKITPDGVVAKEMPAMLEAGTKNTLGIVSLGKAIDFIEKIGVENIHTYLLDLSLYTLQRLRTISAVEFLPGIAFCRCAVGYGVISFRVKGIASEDIGFILDNNNILVRTGNHCTKNADEETDSVRVSLQIYNTKEEVDHFIHVLEGVVQKL